MSSRRSLGKAALREIIGHIESSLKLLEAQDASRFSGPETSLQKMLATLKQQLESDLRTLEFAEEQ
jgi:hypothetical protein